MNDSGKSGDGVKTGVYVCHCGGNISDHVDIERVRRSAEGIEGVTVARADIFMCSEAGQELIMEDIKSGRVNRVVVASCAPSLHETTFAGAIARAGLNPYYYEHANIREQVSWVHHGESATQKAATLVAAAVAKAALLDPLEPVRVEALRHATVIGGGAAGLRAALELARKGLSVALVEKTPFLGGFTSGLSRLAPFGDSAGELVETLARLVLEHSSISVHTCAEVTGYGGFIGNFSMTLRQSPPPSEHEERLSRFKNSGLAPGAFLPFAGVLPSEPPETEKTFLIDTGAVVMATGFVPYKPHAGEYGSGLSPNVVTLADFIKLVETQAKGGETLMFDGKPVRRAAVIHCVGSRQIPGIHEPYDGEELNEHCSRVCCTSSLFWAKEVRERFPGTHVLDFHRDIRTYGRGHETVYDDAAKAGVLFFRFDAESPPVVNVCGKTGGIKISVRDLLSFGEKIEASVDLVVLATGLCAGKVKGLADMMKLPMGADGFLLEVHPKLKPVEVAKPGIYLAGTCQAPMDAGESVEAAQAAAAKASVLLMKGHVDLAPYIAKVKDERCNGCGDCAAACPVEGALSLAGTGCGESAAKKALVNPALCNGCGVCVAACGERAIDVAGFTLSQYEAMVDAIVSAGQGVAA